MVSRFTLAMVPNEPKELKPGMLCRSNGDDSDPNTFYFLDEHSDLSSNALHESVIPFIVDKDETANPEKGKPYLFIFEDGGCCVACPEEINDMSDTKNCFEVKVAPEQIGLVKKDSGGFREMTCEDMNSIMSRDGWLYVEMEDEFTNPEKFTHVSWGDSVPELKLHEGKCIISF